MTKFAGLFAGVPAGISAGIAVAVCLAVPALADNAATTGSSTSGGSSQAGANTFTLSKPAPKKTEPTRDTVVATVNGTPITMGDVIVAYSALPDQYKQMPDQVLFKGIIDQLVQQVALEQEMAGKLTAKDKIILESARRSYLSNAALNPIAQAAVTPKALKAAYDKAVASMPKVTEYHASHILVKTEAEANKIKDEIAAGKMTFAEAAKKDSTDGSAKNGGDLGWFGPGTMVKPFEDAVMKAKVGEVTGPVKTQFGWHLILVTGTRPKPAPTLKQLTPQLTKMLESNAIRAYLKTLTANTKITHSFDTIDPASMKDTALLDK